LAAKPIISRNKSASALFSISLRRLIISSFIEGLPGSELILAIHPYPPIADDRLSATPPPGTRPPAEHEALGLTEAQVRGALATLAEIGCLARYEPEAGKRYQRTETGLQRRVILHHFGETYANAFTRANTQSQAALGAPAPARRPVPRLEASRAPAANVAASRPMPLPQVAQKQTIGGAVVIMGEQRREE